MDFAFFESLSPCEARSLLEAFLANEARTIEETLARARWQGIDTDYGIESLAPLMRWAVGQIKTVPVPEDSAVPVWIRETESYKNNLFDFDELSKPIIFHMAYYMGECFVRNFPGLTWAIGHYETAEKNMPVISGFGDRIEMAAILVVENLFRRVLAGKTKDDPFDSAVQTWTTYAAKPN